jgi:hypothetical protein
MKKITYLLAGLAAFTMISCGDEDPTIKVFPGEEILTAPTLEAISATDFVVIENGNESEQAGTITWTAAAGEYNGTIQYYIQIAPEGSNFVDAVRLFSTGTTELSTSFTFGDINNAMTRLHNNLIANESGAISFGESNSVDVRVMAITQLSENAAYSNTQTITVTPYQSVEVVLPLLAVTGNHQGWSPSTAPLLAASAPEATDFEGFVWLDGEYKFVAPDASGNFEWGNTDWGDDGSFTGILVEQDEVNCNATEAGYYQVWANTGTLTYGANPTVWGVIGSATPGGWDNSTEMAYDNATGTWSVTLDLEGGQEFKFRANNAWDINFGDSGIDGSLEYGGDNIPVEVSGSYTIILDLSQPRAYTYTITQN